MQVKEMQFYEWTELQKMTFAGNVLREIDGTDALERPRRM